MVFGNGGPWSPTTPASVSRKNLTSVISGPGSDLAALDKSQHSLYRCTQTSGGLIINHLYLVSADFQSIIDVSGIISHNHSSSTDGGEFADLFSANPKYLDTMGKYIYNLSPSDYSQTLGAGATLVLDIDGTTAEASLKVSLPATINTEGNFRVRGLLIDFSKRITFQFKIRIETITSFACHNGVNPDDVTTVDSNTQKINAEVCTVTNNNWFLRTATGSAKSSSDSGIPISVNRTGIRLEHYPTASPPRAEMQIDANTVFQKSSDIPITGSAGPTNLFKHSFKNSIAGIRNFFVYGNRLRYTTNDNWV
jgi:hypothetical protein